jgi:hypothetical protein
LILDYSGDIQKKQTPSFDSGEKMKRRLSLSACLAVVLGLCALSGCSEGEDEPAPPPSDAANSKVSGTFSADPNPLRVCGPSGRGKVTLSWDVQGTDRLYINVDKPDGPRMVTSGDRRGKADSGDWVKDGTKFFLMDGSTPTPTQIASVTVNVTREGCP